MCARHNFHQITAGLLICTVCQMIISETLKGKGLESHLPESNYSKPIEISINTVNSGTTNITDPKTFTY